jgi:MFS family permease
LPSNLYSTGNSIQQMVGFGIGPIVGAGLGGIVFERFGSGVLYAGASTIAFSAAVVAWFALRTPALDDPGEIDEAEEPRDVPIPGPDPTI